MHIQKDEDTYQLSRNLHAASFSQQPEAAAVRVISHDPTNNEEWRDFLNNNKPGISLANWVKEAHELNLEPL